MTQPALSELLEKAIASRETLFDSRHEAALRLFNGFTEGCPQLVIDLYAGTVILNNYADPANEGMPFVQEAVSFLQSGLTWLRAGILKTRNGKTAGEKRGVLLFGSKPDRKIREHGVWYAIDPMMNRDASLYLDTRALRRWAIDHLSGRSVLNTFAYTGSLGVASMAGGASRVVHLDHNRQFLNLAKDSYILNGFPVHKQDFITADFFTQIGKFKRTGESFDCVLIDPPFFSSTSKGRVDQEQDSARLINKVRPLINDGGYLVAINNALYISGEEYMRTLDGLCKDGYLKIRELIPAPEDLVGYPETHAGNFITDPAPFNHSTKIAVLEVKRKAAYEA